MEINIGIQENDRREIAEGLGGVLADTYTLYLKTHNYHWNVTGPTFQMLHELFESQYNELAGAVDGIAERIRALDFPAPGSFSEFASLSSIQEANGVPQSQEMVKDLVNGNEAVVRTARSVIKTAQDAGDEGTADLLIARTQAHEKAAWMLRSHLRD